ncbi:uncharacterized protein DS421_10g302670 [Arachis hypogaea]|nr:uncharacterized protein DS421_10g302670 [Arachis hypogaea]
MLERPKFYREQKQKKKEEIMFTDAIGNARYSLLKDLRAEIEVKDGTFSLCFWVYLANSTTIPATIIQQVCSDVSESAPFLVINDHKRIRVCLGFTLKKREARLSVLNIPLLCLAIFWNSQA